MPAVGDVAEATKTTTKNGKATNPSTVKAVDSGGNIERLYIIYDRLNNAENKVTVCYSLE